HWDDQVIVKAFLPRLGTLEVTLQSELVLLHAADAPFLGHKLAVLAHRQAGAGLTHRGHGRLEIARPQSQPRLQSLTERTAAGGDFAERLALESEFVDQRAQARGQHLEITERAVGAVAARKRDPGAADNSRATQVVGHGSHSRPGR